MSQILNYSLTYDVCTGRHCAQELITINKCGCSLSKGGCSQKFYQNRGYNGY